MTDGAPETSGDRRRQVLRTIGVIVAVAGAVAVAVILMQPEGSRPARTSPTPSPDDTVFRGTACAELHVAVIRREEGDDAGFVAAIVAAGRAGERALQTDGERFGAPERLAIEIAFRVEGDTVEMPPGRLTRLLEEAERRCVELGQW